MAGEFQNLTGLRLAQAAVTASAAIVYETPANTRTYIKEIMDDGLAKAMGTGS